MRKSLQISLVAALLLAPEDCSLAQGETAVQFLLNAVSPETNGMGGISSALASVHPMAPAGNPAQLGLFSAGNFVGAGVYTQKTNPFPSHGLADISFSTLAFNAGIGLQDHIGLPISVGIGYSRLYLDLGEFIITSSAGPQELGRFRAYESSDNISVGLGFDSWVKLGIGTNIKFINSHLSPIGTEAGTTEGSGSVTAYDLGLLLRVPAVDIASKAGVSLSIPSAHVEPLLDLTLGFVTSNIGDRIAYVDPGQADPLPRQASLAAGLEAGIVSTLVPNGWKLVSAALLREANDLLVERHADGTWEYLSGVGDISFIDNVLLGKGQSTITQRKGWQIDLVESFSLRGGSVREPYTGYTTSGFGIRLGGILKALLAFGAEDSSSWISFLRENVDLRYDHSKYENSSWREPISYSSLTLILKKVPF